MASVDPSYALVHLVPKAGGPALALPQTLARAHVTSRPRTLPGGVASDLRTQVPVGGNPHTDAPQCIGMAAALVATLAKTSNCVRVEGPPGSAKTFLTAYSLAVRTYEVR